MNLVKIILALAAVLMILMPLCGVGCDCAKDVTRSDRAEATASAVKTPNASQEASPAEA